MKVRSIIGLMLYLCPLSAAPHQWTAGDALRELLSPLMPQVRIPGPGGMAPGGGGGLPTFVQASSAVPSAVAGVVTMPSFVTTAGNAVVLTTGYQLGVAGCGTTYLWTVIGTDGTNTDTFVQVGSYVTQGGNFMCSATFLGSNVHGSATYSVKATLTGSISKLLMAEMQFTVVSAIDQTCSGTAPSGTSVSCSASMTPSTSPQILVAGVTDYYADTPTAGTGFTIPTGATTGGASGMISSEYQICSSGCSVAVTPTFSIAAGGGSSDYSNIIGATIK